MSADEEVGLRDLPADCRLTAYDYDLPAALVAQHPSERRDESRLLVLPASGTPIHASFADLPKFLKPGDLLVANDTRVLRARFFPKRRRGGAAQVLLLHPAVEPGQWEAMARPGKRVRVGDRLRLDADCGIEIVGRTAAGTRIVRFYGIEAEDAMRRYGQTPLPPYIKEPPPDADQRYQTIYAARDGSIAAPTAGLHFTRELIDRLQPAGIGWTTLTLHVGAASFRPVRTFDVRRHALSAERYEISEAAGAMIRKARAAGGRVIAVGTSTLRALEDAVGAASDAAPGPVRRWTRLFIYPGFVFRAADALITNFHLPRSTLLMLACAFGGHERVLAAYREAIERGYRFYSFGDAMLIEPQAGPQA